MNLTEQQYERVAQRLDGRNVTLSRDEQAVCDEIARDFGLVAPALAVSAEQARTGMRRAKVLVEIGLHEDAMGGLLDVEVPPQAMDRAWRRTQAALARPQRRFLGVAAAAASVAAAAAILLVMTMIAERPKTSNSIKIATAPEPGRAAIAEAYVASVSDTQDPVISLLAAEIDQLEADVLASAPPAPMDLDLDQAQRAIEEFWLDEAILE